MASSFTVQILEPVKAYKQAMMYSILNDIIGKIQTYEAWMIKSSKRYFDFILDAKELFEHQNDRYHQINALCHAKEMFQNVFKELNSSTFELALIKRICIYCVEENEPEPDEEFKNVTQYTLKYNIFLFAN